MVEFFQQMVLGIIQGIVEWIPFSSEGVLFYVSSNVFKMTDVNDMLRIALFLHFGTFFAALIYFWSDVKSLVKGMFHYKKVDLETRKILDFILVSTLISGFVGLAFLQFLKFVSTELMLTSKIITFIIGIALIVTGYFQIKVSKRGTRTIYHLKRGDAILLGFMQGLAALPGFSRSGLTISGLLFRRINDTQALRLSFLMSLPIILVGNILLNFGDFQFVGSMLWGFLFAFVFGYATIKGMMILSKKVKFGYFVMIIAVLVMLSAFLF
jgi:undecaprenyl-diphosphatase